MSEEQENKNNNPLSLIFKTNDKGEIIEELNSIKSIPLFFEFLLNEKISQKMKIDIFVNIFHHIIINPYTFIFLSYIYLRHLQKN